MFVPYILESDIYIYQDCFSLFPHSSLSLPLWTGLLKHVNVAFLKLWAAKACHKHGLNLWEFNLVP